MHQQTIVIIGTGYTGKVMATYLTGGDFHVLLCDKDIAKAEALEEELKNKKQDADVEAMQCSFDSAWQADIILLALNFDAQKVVAQMIKDVVNQKILISMVHQNAEIIPAIDTATSQVETLQQILPYTKIVTIFYNDQNYNEAVTEKCPDSFLVTGNNKQANDIVTKIFESARITPMLAE